MNLAANASLLPAASTWSFTVNCGTGCVLPAGGLGPVSFTITGITIAGASQNISAQLQAAALPISIPASGSFPTAANATFGAGVVTLTTLTGNFPAAYLVGATISVTGCTTAGDNISAAIATGGAGTNTLTYADAGGGGPATGCIAHIVSGTAAPPFNTVGAGTNPNALLVSGSLAPTGGGTITTNNVGVASATVLGSNGSSAPIAAGLTNTNIWIGSIGGLPVANALSGDASLANNGAVTNKGMNGTLFSSLATGPLCNTTATGVPFICAAGNFPTLNQNTSGSAASFTGSLTGDVTGTQGATTVTAIHGTILTSLATGPLCNTTSTGVPFICGVGNYPIFNQNTTGTAASITGALTLANTPLTTNNDLLAELGGVLARVPGGTNGTWLGISGGVLAYSTPSVTLSGMLQGQAAVGGALTTNLAPSSARIFASSFRTGAGLTSPCSTLQQAVGNLGSFGNIIDAGDLANTSGPNVGTFAGLSYTNTACGLDSNIFGGFSGGQASTSVMNGGEIDLGPMNLIVSLVPSFYGVCCQTVTLNQTPPIGVMMIPNGVIGLKGRGRGYAGTRNTTITVAASAANGSVAPQARSWTISGITASAIAVQNQKYGAVHREYMTITATANSFGINSISGNGTLATVTMNGLISGELSAGQTVTVSGNVTFNGTYSVCGAGVGGNCTSPPVTVAGVTTFTISTATVGTQAGGSLAVGPNFAPGEYIQIEGATGAANVNDGRWRVCATQVNVNDGVGGDNNCPVALPGASGSPNTLAVVGISADSSPKLQGATSVTCASGCGTIVGVLPVVELGDPTKGNSQFGELVDHILVDCNNVPSCVNYRDLTGNEQSGIWFSGGTGSQEACFIASTNVGQNSYGWFSLECLPDVGQTCLPGSTGYIMSDNGARIINGWTYVAPNSCWPITGFYNDINGTSLIGTGHSEHTIFGFLAGQNAPSSNWVATGVGGMPANPGNVTDGPYQGNPPPGAAAQAVAGAFPQQINGANSAFTSDYVFIAQKKSSNVAASFFEIADDYFGYTSTDQQIMVNAVDTFGSGTEPTHYTTSASVQSTLQAIGTAQNGSAAGTAANPSVVTFSATNPNLLGSTSGAFACSASASTGTCVVNTTAVTTNSRIFIQPTAASPGLTCNATPDTGLVLQRLASQIAGTSFTINLGTFAGNAECFNFWIID